MKSARMYIVGEIDYAAYENFSRQLRKYELENKDRVYVEITSFGGDAYVSLAFADRIRRSTCNIHVIGSGLVASAAVIILAAGHHRVMTKESWLMVHEETESIEKEVHDAEVSIKQLRRMEDQADKYLAERSNLTAKEWKEYHKNTTYFSAKECLEIGLIEEIL